MIREKIYLILRDLGFAIDENVDDVNLLEYGMDSISFVSFIVETENVFNIEIPDEILSVERLASLNGLITYIASVVEDNAT